MVKTGFVNQLSRLGKILLIFTIIFVIVVNTQFNMTGFWLMPAPVSSAFESVKTLFRGSDDRAIDSKSTIAANRTLIEVFEGLRRKNKSSNPTSKIANATLNVLWFNKPVWINLGFSNRALSSACFYDNCMMSSDVKNLTKYAAIVFSFTDKLNFQPPISRAERSRDQVWIFFGLESPVYHNGIAYRHINWKNTMNWSMSYRRDADIFFPYGMLERRKEPTHRNYSKIFSCKIKQAAWLVSNCGAASYRDDFVSELIKYGLNVDIFGVCPNNVFHRRSEILSLINKNYNFFLSFENSFCKDYVTEKFFRYFNLDVVLVVRGGADYDRMLPNNTFINAAHFRSPKALVNFLLEVESSEKKYTDYIKNKDSYIASEMFTMPTGFCSICEKLNNLNDNRRTYGDHVSYVHDDMCWTAVDVPLKISVTRLKDNISTAVFLLQLIIIIFCVAGKRGCCVAG